MGFGPVASNLFHPTKGGSGLSISFATIRERKDFHAVPLPRGNEQLPKPSGDPENARPLHDQKHNGDKIEGFYPRLFHDQTGRR